MSLPIYKILLFKFNTFNREKNFISAAVFVFCYNVNITFSCFLLLDIHYRR